MSRTDGKGLIFDIKRFAVHDGPGIRTTVFLKGCSLHCAWCHNPESIGLRSELSFYTQRCVQCLSCLDACPNGAQRVDEAGDRVVLHDLCDLVGACVDACNAEALVIHGRPVTVEEVMDEVRRDAGFYETSGGGVTLSGGEPLLQTDFATALLRQCKSEGFHAAIDTCGQVSWKKMQTALPYVDMVLFDLKHMDPQRHRQHTGVSNRLILSNLRRLSRWGVPIEVRMPIIPGINDDRESVDAAARLLASLDNVAGVRLLAYHRLAGEKYRSLGLENTMPDVEPPEQNQMDEIGTWIGRLGLKVIVPGRG